MHLPTLHFSTAFDSSLPTSVLKTGHVFCGESGLLARLEQQLGLTGYPENTDYFRIELYRQALAAQLEIDSNCFYNNSFDSDRFATAATLLERRDNLLLAGFFSTQNLDLKSQARLKTLQDVESIFQKTIQKPDNQSIGLGFAGRFEQVLKKLEVGEKITFEKILLYDPQNLLPSHIQRFLAAAKALKIQIENIEQKSDNQDNTTDLGHLKACLQKEGKPERKAVQNDGSLLVMKAKSDTDAAVFLAQLFEKNPKYRPIILAPDKGQNLEFEMTREGLPAPGVQTNSLARPSLQVLKLAPAFLWEPLDIQKIMEFVTLPLKPIEDGLATVIARVLAEKPGLKSDTWFASTLSYIENHAEKEALKEQYNFWFDRRRFPADQSAPKRDALSIFGALYEWALSLTAGRIKFVGLSQLIEQARRIIELLRALPEDRIGYLELERIIRTVYEPAASQLFVTEKNALDIVGHQGALPYPVKDLLWWNCIFTETAPPPDPWRPEERAFLEKHTCAPQAPDQAAALKRFHRNKPVHQTQEQLVLVLPERSEGKPTESPLLLGDIEAVFSNAEALSCSIHNSEGRTKLAKFWNLRALESVEPRLKTVASEPVLSIAKPKQIPASEYETFTSLDDLLHYPHKWFLKSKTRFFAQNILSVKELNQLQGTLAHRFFEDMLKLDFSPWKKTDVEAWVENFAPELLEREGATLLLYGLEPDKLRLISKVKHAAWALIELIRNNDWSVEATELDLEGVFAGMPIRGKADLVLKRGAEKAILDLKWAGLTYRRDSIKSEKDLQLVLYAQLLPPIEQWAHTAYFILESGKLVARNTKAFREAITSNKEEVDHREANGRIYKKMEETFLWRMAEIQRGNLEIRTSDSAQRLEQLYSDKGVPLMDFLELPKDDARWDDYSILLHGT